MTDRRIKALGTVVAANYGRILREGDLTPDAAITTLEAIGKQRTAEARGTDPPLIVTYIPGSPRGTGGGRHHRHRHRRRRRVLPDSSRSEPPTPRTSCASPAGGSLRLRRLPPGRGPADPAPAGHRRRRARRVRPIATGSSCSTGPDPRRRTSSSSTAPATTTCTTNRRRSAEHWSASRCSSRTTSREGRGPALRTPHRGEQSRPCRADGTGHGRC